MIYFDNSATTSPKPQNVINTVARAMNIYSVNPGRGGYKRSIDTSEMIFRVREKVADMFNAKSPENVIFTKNCTESINIAMQGIITAGDRFIISELEHNAVWRTAEMLKSRGADYDIAEVFEDDSDTLRSFESKIQSNTKAIICTHASNVSGEILPIYEIGKLCRKYNLRFIVDAAQTAGVLPIDMQKMNINSLCIASHKGLYAALGTGILISDAKPNPLIYGGTGSGSISHEQPNFTPDKYESGTLNVTGIASIGAGIDFVKSKPHLYEHEKRFSQILHNELSKIEGVEIYTACDDRHTPMITFNVNGKNSEEVASKLARRDIAVRAGLHCAPLAHKKLGTLNRGAVRATPSVFTTERQVRYFVSAVRQIAKN